MQFLKIQDFIKKVLFNICFFLALDINYLTASPTEEDIKNISLEIYNLILQAKSTFESGDLQGACDIAYSILNKWENIDPNQLDSELIDKYYLLDSLVEQNKAKLNEVCLIENSMNP